MITSTSNPKIKHIRALQAQPRARAEAQQFVIEGTRLAEEAARARMRPETVLYTYSVDERGEAALEALRNLGAKDISIVAPSVMDAISDTATPPGLLAVLPFVAKPLPSAITFALVLDRMADPGNVGTMLRTAWAAGAEAVFLMPGTTDVYNPKVVRAAQGAHFHLPLIEVTWEELAQRLTRLNLWLAEAHEGEVYHQVDWRAPTALIIGSEADGPSESARQLAPHRVHIPMPGPAESLNAAVAAGVLLFEVARQRSGG
jgi:TrmH family RNA methyltransferase